jgi:hypothetical protein
MSNEELAEVIAAVRLAHNVAFSALDGTSDKQYALEEVEGKLERIIMHYEIRREREAAELVAWLGGACDECCRAASVFSTDGQWCANCQPEAFP